MKRRFAGPYSNDFSPGSLQVRQNAQRVRENKNPGFFYRSACSGNRPAIAGTPELPVLLFRNTPSHTGNDAPRSRDIARAIAMRYGFSRQKFSKKNPESPEKISSHSQKFPQKSSGKIWNRLKKNPVKIPEKIS